MRPRSASPKIRAGAEVAAASACSGGEAGGHQQLELAVDAGAVGGARVGRVACRRGSARPAAASWRTASRAFWKRGSAAARGTAARGC